MSTHRDQPGEKWRWTALVKAESVRSHRRRHRDGSSPLRTFVIRRTLTSAGALDFEPGLLVTARAGAEAALKPPTYLIAPSPIMGGTLISSP